MKTYIEVNLQHEASHFWRDADKIPEVHYLRYPHRHIFHIRLRKAVSHNDRDVEIIMFKREVEEYLKEKYGKHFGPKSCEMLAEELLLKFNCHSVRVLEDGENGGLVIK